MSMPRVPVTAALVAMLLPIVVACGSSTPSATPTPTPAPVVTPAPEPGMSPGVTVDGTTVTIVGMGGARSDPFELAAGSAQLTITACRSTQVMPFITLAGSTGQSVGLVVDPVKVLANLKGGSYTVSAQTNPDCIWKVVITPV